MEVINIILYASIVTVLIITLLRINKINDQILLFVVNMIIMFSYNLINKNNNKINTFNKYINPVVSENSKKNESEEQTQVKKYQKEDNKIFSLWYKNIYNDINDYSELLNPKSKLKQVNNKHYINRDCLHDLTCL